MAAVGRSSSSWRAGAEEARQCAIMRVQGQRPAPTRTVRPRPWAASEPPRRFGPGRKFWRGRGRRRGFTVCQRARSGDSAQPSQVKRLYFSAYCVGGAIVLHDRAWRTGAAEAGGVAPPPTATLFIVINNVFSRSSARRVAATREFAHPPLPLLYSGVLNSSQSFPRNAGLPVS
jgi:hypothetical protein